MAELNGGRIAAVLAADAEMQVGTGLAAERGRHLDELADAGLVETGERVVLIDLTVVVRAEAIISRIWDMRLK